jgi:hypothetical protein
MTPPRYRTLDGDEVELPLAMRSWVLVPRALARFDPELAWTLDYDDAPEPEDADPRLDFSDGALLVPVDRWNERAELEPNLAPCYGASTEPSATQATVPLQLPRAMTASAGRDGGALVETLAALTARSLAFALAALASSYLVAVGAWLWTLRDGISGPDVSTGLVLVGAAVLLAWLGGVTSAGWPSHALTPSAKPTWPDLRRALRHVSDDPLGIVRAGMTLQLTGFAVLVLVR